MPYRTRALEILEQWRAGEREHDATTDPVSRAALQAQMDMLRARYLEVMDEARAAQMPEPPAFPEPDPQGA